MGAGEREGIFGGSWRTHHTCMPTPAPITLGRVERLLRLRRTIFGNVPSDPAHDTPVPFGRVSVNDQVASSVPTVDTHEESAEATHAELERAAEVGAFVEMGVILFDVSAEEAAALDPLEVALAVPPILTASTAPISALNRYGSSWA